MFHLFNKPAKIVETDHQTSYRKRKVLERYAIDRFMEYIKPEIESVAEDHGKLHDIKEGDEVVLNIYDLLKKSHQNGWDGGLSSFLRSLKDDYPEPITATITSVYTDTSLLSEKLDKIVEGMSDDELVVTDVASVIRFKIGENLPAYRTAKFIPITKFRPQWGLNIYCFLKLGTDEANLTIDLWNKEIERAERRKQLHLDEQEHFRRLRIQGRPDERYVGG